MKPFICITVLLSSSFGYAAPGGDLVVDPPWITFRDLRVGAPVQSQLINVKNDGTETVQALAVQAFSPRNFQIESRCPPDLASSSSCQVEVRFHPTSAGQHACMIRLTGQLIFPETVNVVAQVVDLD